MESFGAYLKGLREEKGKNLEEISESTKVAVSNLRLLESDRYDLLPPRVFVKGFIRAYVQDLGIPAEETIQRFEDFTRDGELPDYSGEDHPVFHERPVATSFIHSPWFTVVLTAAGLISLTILVITGGSRLFSYGRDIKKVLPAITTVQPSKPSAAPTPVEAEQPSTETAFPETSGNHSGKKTLEIKALANAWVRVEPDNGPAEELMMAPGEIQIFTARSRFSVQTGNAGGLRIRYDGKELQTLGKVNQTLSLTLP
jgi:cytoskeletal protein RodZ